MDHEQEIEVLKRQVRALRRDMKGVTEYVDVMTSPLWKRLVWWFQGFRFNRVGRWYGPITYQPRWPR